MKVAKVGGVPEIVVDALYQATMLAIDATGIYYTLAGNTPGVYRAELDGSNATTLDAGHVDNVIAIDETYVYYVTAGSGELRRRSKDGAEMCVLAMDISTALGMAVDGAAVYWTNNTGVVDTDGSVRRVGKTCCLPP